MGCKLWIRGLLVSSFSCMCNETSSIVLSLSFASLDPFGSDVCNLLSRSYLCPSSCTLCHGQFRTQASRSFRLICFLCPSLTGQQILLGSLLMILGAALQAASQNCAYIPTYPATAIPLFYSCNVCDVTVYSGSRNTFRNHCCLVLDWRYFDLGTHGLIN